MRTLIEQNKILTSDKGYFRHGVLDMIADKAKVTTQTIQNVMKGRANINVSVTTRLKVRMAADEVIDEISNLV